MKRKTVTIIIALNILFLVIVFSLSYLLWHNAEVTINAYRESYLAARTEDALRVWRQTLDQSEPARVALVEAFVTRDSLVGFIEKLELVARREGIDLTLSEPVIEVKKLRLNLGARGSFARLGDFLVALENLPYQLAFEKFSFSANGPIWVGSISLVLNSFDDVYVQN